MEDPGARPSSLRADCARCVGLCCVAPAFEAGADFAFDKEFGHACRNLLADFRCAIHDQLAPRGFRGCTAFDCQGAGQKVTQVTFGGRHDWRGTPETASKMFNAFAFMRQLHELLWYLTQALGSPGTSPLRSELTGALAETERLSRLDADALMLADVHEHRVSVKALLERTSELVRASFPGADLRGADLRGASFAGADLSHADLTGADLRDADLRGADLSACLFVTQYQVNTANGDATTELHPMLLRPSHWR